MEALMAISKRDSSPMGFLIVLSLALGFFFGKRAVAAKIAE
jgi:hypothetical protein